MILPVDGSVLVLSPAAAHAFRSRAWWLPIATTTSRALHRPSDADPTLRDGCALAGALIDEQLVVSGAPSETREIHVVAVDVAGNLSGPSGIIATFRGADAAAALRVRVRRHRPEQSQAQ